VVAARQSGGMAAAGVCPADVLAAWIGRGVSGRLEWALRLGAVRTLRSGDRVRVRRWHPGPISSDEGDVAGEDDGDDDGDDYGAGVTSARIERGLQGRGRGAGKEIEIRITA